MSTLQNKTLEELKSLKIERWNKACEEDKISKLKTIARHLGASITANHGSTYVYQNNEFSIYVDDYGGLMWVSYANGTLVSTQEHLYCPGKWEELINVLFPVAEEIRTAKIEERKAAEKKELLNNMEPALSMEFTAAPPKIFSYYEGEEKADLVAVQIPQNVPWDRTPATYHRLSRKDAALFGRILANVMQCTIRITYPKTAHADLGRQNGSYFSPQMFNFERSNK